MTVTVAVPEECVGDVIGDLNSRRGRPLGMEPKGSVTEIKAEVPMAEMLDYAPDLRAITGGQGEYSMDLARYEEVPGARGAAGRASRRSRRRRPSRPDLSWRAVKKELRPVHDAVSCDVCGRTILKGERAEWYLAPGGHRRQVCDLCAVRAQHDGWIRESGAGDMPARVPRNEPRRGVLGPAAQAAPGARRRRGAPGRARSLYGAGMEPSPTSIPRGDRGAAPRRRRARAPGRRARATCAPCPPPPR